jgi:hypothetical protein
MRDLSHLVPECQNLSTGASSQSVAPVQKAAVAPYVLPVYTGVYNGVALGYAEPVEPVEPVEVPERMKLGDGSWIVFFKGRRTAVAVSAATRSEAISKARAAKRRGGDQVVQARQATAAERKTASGGGWIKSRPPGFKESMRGQGPKPNAS